MSLIRHRGITYGSLMSPYQRYLPIPWALLLPPVPHVRRHHWISNYQHHLPIPTSNVNRCFAITVVGQRLSSFSFLFPRFLIPSPDNVVALKPGCTCKRVLLPFSPLHFSPVMYACNYRRFSLSLFFPIPLLFLSSRAV